MSLAAEETLLIKGMVEGGTKMISKNTDDFVKPKGNTSNIIGNTREERVANIVDGYVSKNSKGQDLEIFSPKTNKPVPIDVIDKNGNLYTVGGAAKANKVKTGDLHRHLKGLVDVADQRGVKAGAYYDKNTPQIVIDIAEDILGNDNVLIIPD